jgi:hypothetical protein
MAKTNRSEYTALDFQGWQVQDALNITPKFQRRGVWTTPAKSYLIDTLIREMPVPPLYLRVVQSADRKKIVREVVDGQQRISAVLDFLAGKFALSSSLESPFAGRKFAKLPLAAQDAVTGFPFICEILQGVSDKEVLEIFARLNQNSVPLNEQELRNGTFFGYFKQTAYRLAYEHVQLWKALGVFSDQKIARMLEVEFTSELLVAQIAGMQDKKKSIGDFYEKYDENFPDRLRVSERFRKTIDLINETLGEVIKETPFKRSPIFYSLFCAVYHRVYGLPELDIATPKKPLSDIERERLKSAVARLSDLLAQFDENENDIPLAQRRFAIACSKQTDNIEPRKIRCTTIYKTAFGSN